MLTFTVRLVIVFELYISDIDECRLHSNLCENGRCMNTMGSYRCVCNNGFKPDTSGTQCIGEYGNEIRKTNI